MTERSELRAQERTVLGKKVKRLRADGWIPAVLYGPDTPAAKIQIEERELYKTLQEAGSTALIDLYVGKERKPNLVLARDIQRDLLTGQLRHVDFYQVRLDEKVKTTPILEVVGESPLVRGGGAVLVQILNQVEVECLPTDLIHSIPVDVSALESLDDSITIGDLPVPPGVTILADLEDTVISLVPPRIVREELAEEELVEELPLRVVAKEAEAAVEEDETSPED